MGETKIIYHIDDEETPYLVKLPIAPDRVTLADFKNVLNRPNFKYFFKSMDDDFGVVKEEIVDDDAHLPCFNGRVVSWLVSAEGSNVSDSTSQCTESVQPLPVQQPVSVPTLDVDDTAFTETESVVSSRCGHYNMHKSATRPPRYDRIAKYDRFDAPLRANGHGKHHAGHGYETSSMMSSDLETTSFLDSEDDGSSRITTTTAEHSSVSRIHSRHRRQRRRRHRMPAMSRTSSFSSITDSTMSLNIITVTLNMDTVNFLGISIVGQSNKGGDGGIYVGSIMKGGAVALDGRIEPGDMILQVNDINFENMSNDEAVRVLREVVQKPGPIKLVVAKCWDPNPKGYFTIPRSEPVRPIDPGAWVAHTAAVRGNFGDYPGRPPSVSTVTSASSSIASSMPELDRPFEELRLTVNTDMSAIVRAMARPDSGLEIHDRMWLKITIPNAFIGADVVEWLFTRVDGFQDRREARKYANQMLKAGYIRHTVNKITFSEQCYYVFGDLCGSMSTLKLHHDDLLSETDRDTLAPLPPPTTPSPWGGSQMPYAGTYVPHAGGYAPMPFNYTNEPGGGFGLVRDESVHSGSGGSSNSSERPREKVDPKPASPRGSGSDSEGGSQHSGQQSSGSEQSATTIASQPPCPSNLLPQRTLDLVNQDVSGSRQSFRMAMGNPCEFFVDVM